jgi:membrane-bound lytic murein transglycosylase D
MTSRSWLLPAAFFAAACAAKVPPPKVAPKVAASQTAVESKRYEADLRDAYAHIVAHERATPGDPLLLADVDAVASIAIPQHWSIDAGVKLFTTKLRDDIQTYLTRSARYRPAIDAVLTEYQLPKALAYLPVIESGYSSTMTSRAGAHGMWQFMGETAREYGLKINWWVDERADPDRATRAAAAYLRDLYRDFGDWPLALAAYNCGSSRVHRALQANGATTFWELYDLGALPKETRGYVPTFFATIIIAGDPAAYGFQLPPDSQEDVAPVMVEGPVSLKYIASIAELDEAKLQELNPWMKRGIVPPGRNALKVPAPAATSIAPHAATLKNDDPDIAVCTMRVKSGTHVKSVARALGTTPEAILEMNGKRSIDEGDTIYVPARARDLAALLAAGDAFYTVRKKDTLYSIAKRHGLSVVELRELNGLASHASIHPGDRLRVSPTRAVTAGGM